MAKQDRAPLIDTFEEAFDTQRQGRRDYTTNYKRQVVITYLRIGKVRTTAREVGMDHSTLSRWISQPWWQLMVDDIKADRATNPTAIALTQRLDGVIKKMLARLEEPGVIDKLNAREIAFNLKQTLMARNLEKGDDAGLAKKLAGLPSEDLKQLIKELQDEIATAEAGGFGESSHKAEEQELNEEDAVHEVGAPVDHEENAG
jgi:transposase-like protein